MGPRSCWCTGWQAGPSGRRRCGWAGRRLRSWPAVRLPPLLSLLLQWLLIPRRRILSRLLPVILTRLPPRLALPPACLQWDQSHSCLCVRPVRLLRVHPAGVLGRPCVMLIHALLAVHGGLRHPLGCLQGGLRQPPAWVLG